MWNRRLFSSTVCALCAAAVQAQQTAPPDDLSELLALLNTPVVSASKSKQSIGQAPAKIVAITAEDIRTRGYVDLNQIFHDYAGFDISRGRGVEWTTIFMRGIRTENTDRFLMIWDGVIQNDVWKANVWISRQYPLANIERIEIMYGPSSLLYGANAFAGIVNIILKKPKDMNGFAIQAGTGSFNTKWAEFNFGKEIGQWNFMANARIYRSDEFDANGKYWVDNAGRQRFYNLRWPVDYVAGAGTPPSPIVLDPGTGLPTRLINGVRTVFDGNIHEKTNDWFVQLGAGYKGFNLKAYYWYREEPEDTWYVSTNRRDGPWIPTGSAIYATYDQNLGANWSAKHYAIMRTSGIDGENSYDRSHSFAVDNDPTNPIPIKVSNIRPVQFQGLFNREYRIGTQLNFAQKGLTAVTGVEHTRTKNYGDYNYRDLSTDPWQSYTPGSTQKTEGNLAWYGNAQMDVGKEFSLSAGLRYDYNWIIGETGGLHSLFTGRMAGIYTPSDRHRFKVIYGQAFQAPSSWHKYSTVAGSRDIPNPNLKPERLNSTELMYELTPVPRWKNTFSLYYTQVTDLIKAVAGQHQNVAGVNIFGIEAESTYYFDKNNSIYGNLTTNSAKVAASGQDTGDIAPYKANAGWNALFRQAWGISLRGHYVAERKTVTQYFTPPASYFSLNSVDAYFTVDLTLTARNLLKGFDLNLALFNITNKTYYDPGLREADGTKYAGAIIQPGFNGILSATYRF